MYEPTARMSVCCFVMFFHAKKPVIFFFETVNVMKGRFITEMMRLCQVIFCDVHRYAQP